MAYKITDKCNGCDDCAQLCPVRAISGEMKEQHEIDPNRCIDCGACSHICEYESILDNEGKACKCIPKEQWKKPFVDTTVCDGCGICEEDCPAYCIDIIPNEKNPIHNVSFLARPEDCHGCGVCERHCPIDAITMK